MSPAGVSGGLCSAASAAMSATEPCASCRSSLDFWRLLECAPREEGAPPAATVAAAVVAAFFASSTARLFPPATCAFRLCSFSSMRTMKYANTFTASSCRRFTRLSSDALVAAVASPGDAVTTARAAATPLTATRKASSRSAADVFPASTVTLAMSFFATSTETNRDRRTTGSCASAPDAFNRFRGDTTPCSHDADAIASEMGVNGTAPGPEILPPGTPPIPPRPLAPPPGIEPPPPPPPPAPPRNGVAPTPAPNRIGDGPSSELTAPAPRHGVAATTPPGPGVAATPPLPPVFGALLVSPSTFVAALSSSASFARYSCSSRLRWPSSVAARSYVALAAAAAVFSA